MAKKKRSADDLDAELAALEAELAALEGKKAAAPPPSPAPPPAPAEKKKLRFPLSGKKPAPEEAPKPPEPKPAHEGEFPLAPEPSPSPSPPPSPAPSSFDATLWRQDGDAWVRAVPATQPQVVRRILDEDGNVVREERATRRDVDEATGVKAERGVGKLLGRFKK